MVQLNLRKEAELIDVQLKPATDPADIALVKNTWRGRMVSEHASARVYAQLLPQAMQAGLSAERQSQIADMIVEELRHARKCAGVLVALDEDPIGDLPSLAPIPDHEDAGPLETVLRNVLSISCLSETVAVSLIDAERLELAESPLAEVLRVILADEIGHARFGWKLLEDLAPLPEDMLERLSAYLKVALRHLEVHETSNLGRATPSADAARLGACDGPFAQGLFYDTVEQVIVPRLEQHGFAAQAAWQSRVG